MNVSYSEVLSSVRSRNEDGGVGMSSMAGEGSRAEGSELNGAVGGLVGRPRIVNAAKKISYTKQILCYVLVIHQ